MKKSLSRVLSLALVLVMLIGVMPMASAANCAEGAHSWDAGTTTTPATCKVPGVKTYACTNGDCAATRTEEIPVDATKHTVEEWSYAPDYNCEQGGDKSGYCEDCNQLVTETVSAGGQHSYGDFTIVENATCVKAGKKTQTCGVCEYVNEVSIPADGTSHNYDPTTGKCTNKEADNVTVCGAQKPVTYTATISNSSMTLAVGESGSVSVSISPAYSNADISFSSSDSTVASVDDNGVITALKKGSATITASVSEPAGIADLTCAVTVKAGAIDCDNVSVEIRSSGTNTYTLEPVYGSETPDGVTFSYSIASGYSGSVSNSGLVSFSGDGYTKVNITAKKGSETLATTSVYVSFYYDQSEEVTMKNNISKFSFGDSTALTCGESLYSIMIETLSDYTYSTYVQFTTLGGASDTASLTLPAGVGSSTTQETVPLSYLDDVILTVREADEEFVFGYEFITSGVKCGTGVITVNLSEGGDADITYKTDLNTAVTLDEDDFADFWNEYYKKSTDGDLSYVIFDISSKEPEEGILYTDSSKKTTAKYTMEFSYKAASSDDYDLDTVVYVPNKYATKNYVDTVSFTCYGTKGEELTGVLAFEVNGELPFTDVDDKDWFYEDVLYIYNSGIMNGTSSTKFSPNNYLTRGMVVTMLYRIEGEPSVIAYDTFTDVDDDEWYYKAVEWAAKNDIVNGLGNGKFGPNQNITREQLAAILFRYADCKNSSTRYGSSLTKFTDYKSVSSYAEEALEWAVYEGIITGDGNKLMPKGNATRAQAAAMFHRFLED